ncbi:uncharacterized protein LOC119104668 [Pollicipes pollicipes]|uniref:uncharacterized protein LOC119104668 n=1 Tax=Pollicipes pollicipes TaxID=41117 RepID=UPI00188537E5|nr:uncharacterized protein LOC119104668 [Pollicipes pollicipes]
MSPPRQPDVPTGNVIRVLAPIMAPRANSGLETHEEEIIGDSPTLEPYLHRVTNETSEHEYDELGKEEEGQEKISIIVGIVVALLLAILIVIVCAAVIRRMRRRGARLPASAEDGKGIRLKRVKPGKGMVDDYDGEPSPLDDLHDPFLQFVYIPPNRGLKLWKGRLKIMTRHMTSDRLALKSDGAPNDEIVCMAELSA